MTRVKGSGQLNGTTEVVMITGASAGVGRAITREFAKRQASIGLIARGKERLAAAKAEVEAQGGRALVFPIDVADSAAVDRAAQTLENEFGPIDIWINDAMTTIFAPLSEITPDEFKRATEVTYLGCVYGTMAALKRMLPRDKGTIVQIGSALAYRSIPLQAPYCGAKHAIVGFTDSLRCELIHEHSKVHVTAVHLPALNTPQFNWCRTRLPRHPQPVPPIFEPEVAARAIYWAAHHKRREVFVGGSTMKAIYGQDVAPAFADWYLGQTGYSAQQTSQPVSPDRPDNLFEPVAADYAANGIFTDVAKSFSGQNWINLRRVPVSLIAAGIFGLTAMLWKMKR
ncbi:MAG TPA: SDR family oxidoreductase [Bryobacteraceae bacterium]|nr:SDR family oxidoreductase [Bryobacteraceae bacterium]